MCNPYTEKPKIIIEVKGGVVQAVTASKDMDIVDHDTLNRTDNPEHDYKWLFISQGPDAIKPDPEGIEKHINVLLDEYKTVGVKS